MNTPKDMFNMRSTVCLLCCPTKVRDAVGEYILLFSITTTATAVWWRTTTAATPPRRRRPEAAAPCMASQLQHRKTLCSPIFVFSSHIIIFRWQALQFGFVPSQPSCQSNIICYEHNQPFDRANQRMLYRGSSCNVVLSCYIFSSCHIEKKLDLFRKTSYPSFRRNSW